MTHRATRTNSVIDHHDAVPGESATDSSQGKSKRSTGAVFAVVAFLLLSSGWATNHFASMLAVLRDHENFAPVIVNGAFGIYAIGLVPCLLIGGLLADRFGSRPVVLTGALAAAAGNVILLLWQTTSGLLLGRLIVGLGVGLAISAGTTWASRLRGANGVVLAGILMTTGFAVGPIVSGMLAYFLPSASSVTVPFIVAIALSCIAVLASLIVGNDTATSVNAPTTNITGSIAPGQHRSMRRALATSIPMALWVFSTAAIALVTLTERVDSLGDAGLLLPGFAAFLAFSAALIAQALGRRFGWGPKSGIVAALIAAAGLILTGLGAATPPLWLFIVAAVLLGVAYGMCLREGLLDVETYAPSARRGATIGIYYIFTYLGFALPVLFEWLLPVTGYAMPLFALGISAIVSAVVRALQIRSGVLARS